MTDERIARAWLERRRTSIGTFAMKPGEVFPMRIDWPYGGSGIYDYYTPVHVDDAVQRRAFYQRWSISLRAIIAALERRERVPWLREWARGFRGDVVSLLFYLLEYDITLQYEVDPRGAASFAAFRYALDTDDDKAVFHLLAPRTDAFVESLDEVREHMALVKAAQDMVLVPMFRGLLIIERELAIMLIGGEVLRLGGWLVTWASDTRIVVSAIRTTLTFVQRFEAGGAVLGIARVLFAVAKALGRALMTLLDVIGTNDVLLEIIPDLVTLERRVFDALVGLVGLQKAETIPLDGWVVEDDPVEIAFANRIGGLMNATQ